MRNQTKIGMRYKTKNMIYDETSCYMFLNESSVARYLGVTVQAVHNAIAKGRCCKGHKLEKVNRVVGSFYYEEDFNIYDDRKEDLPWVKR